MSRRNLGIRGAKLSGGRRRSLGEANLKKGSAIGEERRLLVKSNLCELDSLIEVDDHFDLPVVAAADASAPSTSLSHYSKYIEDLSLKRGSNRKKALEKLVDVYEDNVLTEFTENKYITLSYWSLKLIKNGTTVESHLACRLIGMLAVNIDCKDSSHEMMKETIPLL